MPHGQRLGSADAAMILVAVVWGASFAVIKHAYEEIDVWPFLSARFLIAAAAALPVLALYRSRLPSSPRKWTGVLLIGLTGVAGYQALFSLGLQYTTAIHSTLIVATVPLFTAVIAALLGLGRPKPEQWLGLVLALAGVYLLVAASGVGVESGGVPGDLAPGGVPGDLASGQLRGDLLTLGAALSAGTGSALAGRYLGSANSVATMLLALIVGGLALALAGLPAALAFDWSGVSGPALAELLYAAVLAGALGYVLWYHNLARLGPVRGSFYGFLIPVVGVATAVWLLGEPFGWRRAGGAALVLLGLAVARGWLRLPRRHVRPGAFRKGRAG